MKIVADENISFAAEAFSQFGNVTLMQGRRITNESLKDVDALIVRSITRVDEELLKNTKVRFVGTATIGTDHIDLKYLKLENIFFTDAKGCNADAVAEYVFTSILTLANNLGISIKDKTIGIIGVGNIGSRVNRLANTIGIKVLKNDPPLQRERGSNEFIPLDKIFDADIITLHVPLNLEGIDKTVHLLNKENSKMLKQNTILINASRGQVVDNEALLEAVSLKNLNVVLDVWENEPGINTELLSSVNFGTPHIAGYSLEGKVNGTTMIYNALCRFLNQEGKWKPLLPIVEDSIIEVKNSGSLEKTLYDIFNYVYNIKRDDLQMREILKKTKEEQPRYFDLLRKLYPLRREFINYKIRLNKKDDGLINILKAFRFEVIN